MYRKGFSLVELVIALGILIIMTGAAALYLGDIYFKSQVAKAMSDMETIANALILHDAENGQDLFETGLPGYKGSSSDYYGPKDELRNLLGSYLSVLPSDPWGNNYRVNAYAGWVRSFAADYKIGGTSKYEKDISVYYLPEDLAVAKIRVEDTNANLTVDTDDVLRVYFTKSVRCNVTDSGSTAAYRGRTTAGGGDTIANLGAAFEYQDFGGIQPDGTWTDLFTGSTVATAGYDRPDDTPYSESNFSRVLTGTLRNVAANNDFETVWKIGNEVYIPTGVYPNGVAGGADRSRAYCIWESTQGYKTYKTPGEINKIYLLKQSGSIAKRTVLFRGLVD
jgi:type II secretory pathway pseudopilin PulG